MARVILTHWQPGMLAIPVVNAIREHTGLGLAEAKHAIDGFLEESGSRCCARPTRPHTP